MKVNEVHDSTRRQERNSNLLFFVSGDVISREDVISYIYIYITLCVYVEGCTQSVFKGETNHQRRRKTRGNGGEGKAKTHPTQ